uniref:Spore germination protein n=1 Tax=Paenibacillus polymyxa TaxID=1406 RepID=A0AAE9PS11_PAEPO
MIRYPYRKHNKKSGADRNKENSSRSLKIEAHLDTNLQQIKESTSNSPDFLIRRFNVGLKADVPAAIVFLDSMVKTDTVNELVMKSLLSRPSAEVAAEVESAEELYNRIQAHALELGEVKDCDDWNSMMEQLLMGDTIILLEGCKKTIACGTRGGETRGLTSPPHSLSSRGRRMDLWNPCSRTSLLYVGGLKAPILRWRCSKWEVRPSRMWPYCI